MRTFVWLLSSVYHLMFSQMVGRLQVGIAMCARETCFVEMASHVVRQVSLPRKLPLAFRAGEFLHLFQPGSTVSSLFLLDLYNLEIVLKVAFLVVDAP